MQINWRKMLSEPGLAADRLQIQRLGRIHARKWDDYDCVIAVRL